MVSFKVKWLLVFFLINGFIFNTCVAWETDQYTLSEQPLADIGVDVSTYIYEKLALSLLTIKQRKKILVESLKRLKTELWECQLSLKAFTPQELRSHREWKIELLLNKQYNLTTKIQRAENKLILYKSDKGVATIIAEIIGRSIAKQEQEDAIWGNVTNLTPYPSGMKNGYLIAFYPDRLDTVYAFAGFHRILHPSYFILSSTIKLYGVELGMDKLGHILNEGFQYYLQFIQARNAGSSKQNATKEAVRWGVETESSYYGSWVSGIYSNADLASNYAGLYFYLNLFEAVTINNIIYPAILNRDQKGDYLINQSADNLPEQLLKRFISFHMNEALNPSSLEYLQYIVIKEAVKRRCSLWEKRDPDLKKVQTISGHLGLWNGEYYGFRREHTVSVYDSCSSGRSYISFLTNRF